MQSKKANTGATTLWSFRAFPLGISRQICFFSEVGLSDQCPQPSFALAKYSKHHPGIKPSTFGVAVGGANHYTIQAARISYKER
jgi:hypothetical protein